MKPEKINPELLARAYSMYEYYMSLQDQVPFSFSMDTPSANSFSKSSAEDELETFIKQLEEEERKRESEESGDDDEGGDTAKGLRGDEQMRDIAANMRRPM